MAEKVRSIINCGIPVMGHVGLTPQSIYQLGGYKVQGKTLEAALSMVEDAQALEEAGAFAIILETVPAPLAALITHSRDKAHGLGELLPQPSHISYLFNDFHSNSWD